MTSKKTQWPSMGLTYLGLEMAQIQRECLPLACVMATTHAKVFPQGKIRYA